jgi:prophage antirepressor-like protein
VQYTKENDEDRQAILESCGFHFIRIVPDEYDEEVLIKKIEEEIKEYELLYVIDIDPEKLWDELQDASIDVDFFNFIGKSIVSNKKYCTDFEDIVKYLQYSNKANAKKLLLEKFNINIDFILIKQNDLKNRDDIFCSSILMSNNLSAQGGHNKQYIFLSKFAFYTFALLAQTTKGKQIRKWIVDVYGKYQQLLIYARQNIILKKKEQESKNAIVLYRQRQKSKDERRESLNKKKLNRKDRALEYINRKKIHYEKVNLDNKMEISLYKEMCSMYEKELNDVYETCEKQNTDNKCISAIMNYALTLPTQTQRNKYKNIINKIISI